MLKYLWILCLIGCSCTFKWNNETNNERYRKKGKICSRILCGKEYTYEKFTSDDRYWVLRAHNFYRNEVALGKDIIGGNSEASNMRVLSYDLELGKVAECYVKKCSEIKLPEYCKKIGFTKYGLNLFNGIGVGKLELDNKKWLLKPIASWFDQIANTTKAEIDSFRKKINAAQFTQLVWAESTYIGCAHTKSISEEQSCLYFSCFYVKKGNIPGKSVYSRGKPCSKCGKDKCNRQYKGLCGEIIMQHIYHPSENPHENKDDKGNVKSLTVDLHCCTLSIFRQMLIFLFVFGIL